MTKDPILKEVHEVRAKFAARFNYDPRKMYEYFLNKQEQNIAKGEKYQTPYYIQVVKEELTKVGDMFSFPSEKAIVQTMTESNDQN